MMTANLTNSQVDSNASESTFNKLTSGLKETYIPLTKNVLKYVDAIFWSLLFGVSLITSIILRLIVNLRVNNNFNENKVNLYCSRYRAFGIVHHITNVMIDRSFKVGDIACSKLSKVNINY
jgi:hypothetical protein